MRTIKSIANTALNDVERYSQRAVLRSKPLVVDVVLTKACNFACTFCRDYETEGAQRISVENFEKVARQLLPTANWLSFCSGGEPYLHKGLEDILRIAKSYNRGLHTWVLSNGSILREDRIKQIVAEDLISEHGFSVDGIKAKTVEGIRLNAKLDVIFENVAMLKRIRDNMGKINPTITIRFALMRSNIEELPEAIEYWGKFGANRLATNWLALANGMDPQLSLYYHQDLAARVFAEARKAAEKFPHLKVELPEMIDAQRKYKSAPKKCYAPWNFVMIDTNGQVLPCYRAFEALRFPSLYGADGIAFDQIWNTEQYQKLRATVNSEDGEKYYPYCSKCEVRYGDSDEATHLGDTTWIDALGDKWLTAPIDHKRPLKGTAAKEASRERQGASTNGNGR